MSQPPDNLTPSPMGLQATPGTPGDPLTPALTAATAATAQFYAALDPAWAATPPPVPPSDDALVAQLQEQIRLRRDRLLDAMLQQHGTGGYYASPARPLLPPPAADPWAPAPPLAHQDGALTADRKAVFNGPAVGACLRCGRGLDGCGVVAIAPPGLPRVVVHLSCLEAGDQVQPRPEAP